MTPEQTDLLLQVAEGLPMLADISRADATLLVRQGDKARVIAQAQPRSIASLYRGAWIGRELDLADKDYSPVREALMHGRRSQIETKLLEQGAAIVRQAFPILHRGTAIPAALQLETSLIAWERQRRRSPSFQRAVIWLQEMAVRGDLRGTAELPGLSEWDGILFVDDNYRIQYLSGIANNLYRRLGYLNELRGQHIGDLQTHDEILVRQALETLQCQMHQVDEGPLNWTRIALPIWSYRQPWWRLNGHGAEKRVVRGVLVLVHDNTEALRKAQELRVLNAMVKDVHHRVKNNLQKVASLLRMQARRAGNPETRRELEEAVNRILAVSTIHEFLTQSPDQLINIREISQRIVSKTQRSAIHPEAEVTFQVQGPAIYLPTRQATACALVIDELVINALKYAFPDHAAGRIAIALEDLGDEVRIQVEDNGVGLPAGFDWQTTETLGLSIVRILVEDDLKGTFSIAPADPGTRAVVQFKKGSPTDD